MKNPIFAVIAAIALTASAHALPILSPKLVVHDGSPVGTILFMSQMEAANYCVDHGGHLPSAREFAQVVDAGGALGIRETEYPGHASDSPEVKAEVETFQAKGYFPVFGTVAGQRAVDFYFNPYGYPPEIGGGDWFWTSSPVGSGFNAVIQGDWRGFWVTDGYAGKAAVRCVVGQTADVPFAAPAWSGRWSEVVRKVDGALPHLNQIKAAQYCESIGAHLPNNREFAEWATAHGAKGIHETRYPKEPILFIPDYSGRCQPGNVVCQEIRSQARAGYSPVLRTDPWPGYVYVDFYLNSSGYRSQSGEAGSLKFWSASDFKRLSDWIVYVFDASIGSFLSFRDSPDSRFAGEYQVRCAK